MSSEGPERLGGVRAERTGVVSTSGDESLSGMTPGQRGRRSRKGRRGGVGSGQWSVVSGQWSVVSGQGLGSSAVVACRLVRRPAMNPRTTAIHGRPPHPTQLPPPPPHTARSPPSSRYLYIPPP